MRNKKKFSFTREKDTFISNVAAARRSKTFELATYIWGVGQTYNSETTVCVRVEEMRDDCSVYKGERRRSNPNKWLPRMTWWKGKRGKNNIISFTTALYRYDFERDIFVRYYRHAIGRSTFNQWRTLPLVGFPITSQYFSTRLHRLREQHNARYCINFIIFMPLVRSYFRFHSNLFDIFNWTFFFKNFLIIPFYRESSLRTVTHMIIDNIIIIIILRGHRECDCADLFNLRTLRLDNYKSFAITEQYFVYVCLYSVSNKRASVCVCVCQLTAVLNTYRTNTLFNGADILIFNW